MRCHSVAVGAVNIGRGVGPGALAYMLPRYMGSALAAPGGERLVSNDLWTYAAHSELLNLLAGGGIVALAAGTRHAVRARTDGAFLLTIAWSGRSAG